MRLIIPFEGLEVEVRYEAQPDYISPRATEDSEQGFEDFEIIEARYVDVPEFLQQYFEYWDRPAVIAPRWLPECPVAGAPVHEKVYDWLAKYTAEILDAAREEARQ